MADNLSPSTGIRNPRSKVKGVTLYRPSYNPENAQAFRPLFDRMIATMKDEIITEADSGYTRNTLYIKANDALKWLVDNDKDSEKYSLLRCRIKVQRTTEGIRLTYRKQLADLIYGSVTSSTENVAISGWKDEFDKWYATAQPYDVFERTNVEVTDQQKASVTAMMNALNSDTAEVAITLTTVKVMR